MHLVLASASADSTAPASAYFDRWVDHSTWQEWDPDTESASLDGPARVGATGRLKPRGGPAVRFTVLVCKPSRQYTVVSRILGARLTFQHLATPTEGDNHLETKVWLDGPLAWLWFRVMGKGFASSVPAAHGRLIALVEAVA